MKTLFIIVLLRFVCQSCCNALTTTTTEPAKQRRRIQVIRYEDDWVCVNKPEGVTVHANRFKRNQPTLRSMLKRQFSRKVHPVHRLDHRTSGAILFAFDSKTCGTIHEQLKQGKKDYVALLRGEWSHNETTVTMNEPILHKETGVLQEARTDFTLLATSCFRDMPCSLVLCHPQTGRTHQIRRHARKMNHPIVGDSQHGDSHVNRAWRTQRGLNRLALHCLSIQLNDDDACTAPLTPTFRDALEQDAALWQTATAADPRLLMDPIDELGGTFGRHYRNQVDKDGVKR